MNEVHVVLLDNSKFATVAEYINVFKAAFQSEEEFLFHRPELRAEAETEHPVLVTSQTVLVNNAAVPIVTLPEIRLPPVVAHLAKEFDRMTV